MNEPSGTPVEQAATAVAAVFKKQGQAPRYTVLIAEAVIEALQLTEERELLHAATFEGIGDGLTVSSSNGFSGTAQCHLCESVIASGGLRETFDAGYRHMVDVHDVVAKYRRRLVGPWRTAQKEEHRE